MLLTVRFSRLLCNFLYFFRGGGGTFGALGTLALALSLVGIDLGVDFGACFAGGDVFPFVIVWFLV